MEVIIELGSLIGKAVAEITGENEVVIQTSDSIFIILIIMVIASIPTIRNRILNPYEFTHEIKDTQAEEREDNNKNG